MCPPAATRIANMEFDSSDEDLFKSLENMISGLPLPDNVIDDINPFTYAPFKLPVDFWYLLQSKEMDNVDFGFWKVKAESMVFSNPAITGWRTTHEFFEGQVPNEYKTGWLMHEYWITRRGEGENNHVKEASTLCRVFFSNEPSDIEIQQRVASSRITNKSSDLLRQSVDRQARHSSGSSSPCKLEENKKNDDTGISAVAEGPLNHQIEDPPEIEYVFRGDYLELLDLENPGSPFSSSDDSSCLSISSDDCFDSMAFLRELEYETGPGAPEKVEHCKLSFNARGRSDEVVVLPTSPDELRDRPISEGAFVDFEENKPSGVIIRADSHAPDQTEGDTKDKNDHVPNHSAEREKAADNADEGPSTNHGDAGSSSGSPSAGKKDAKGKKEKLKRKYLCFMPFHMFF